MTEEPTAYEYQWVLATAGRRRLTESGAEGWRVVPGIMEDAPDGLFLLMERPSVPERQPEGDL